jgi:hypothetical protein
MYDGYAHTDMKTLLYDLKALVKSHMDGSRSTNLKGLKTLKRGVLSATNTIFPAISFFPSQETLSGYRNGGLYRVDRSVNIELYVKQPKPTDSMEYLQELAHYVTDMFEESYDAWQFPNQDGEATIFSYSPLSIQYESLESRDQIIQSAVLPMVFSSWEQAPTFTTYNTITESDLRTIGEYVHDFMRTDAALGGKAKFFFSSAYPPIQVGQGVIVATIENVCDSTRREAGRLNPNSIIEIVVWTKASPFEGALDLNLEVVELIKDTIQANPNLNGKCSRSYFTNIQYGINQQAVLYASKLELETWSYKTMTQDTAPTEPHSVFIEDEDGSLV